MDSHFITRSITIQTTIDPIAIGLEGSGELLRECATIAGITDPVL